MAAQAAKLAQLEAEESIRRARNRAPTANNTAQPSTSSHATAGKAPSKASSGQAEAKAALHAAELRRREEADIREATRQSLQSAQLESRGATPVNPFAAVDTAWDDVSINCQYIGTFEVGSGLTDPSVVKRGISAMHEHRQSSRPAIIIVCLEGIKIVDKASDKVAMAHALTRVSIAHHDPAHALFGFVAKNPGQAMLYCHVFGMMKAAQAEHCHNLVMRAFRLAYASSCIVQPAPPVILDTALYKGEKNQAQMSPHPVRSNPPPNVKQPIAVKAPATAAPPPYSGRTIAPPTTAVVHRSQEHRASIKAWAHKNPVSGSAMPATTASSFFSNSESTYGTKGTAVAPSAPPASASEGYNPFADNDLKYLGNKAEKVSDLEKCAWYQGAIPREIAIGFIAGNGNGAFVVRESTSQPGQYALTMKGADLINHFIIRSDKKSFTLGAVDLKEPSFSTMKHLVTYYTKFQGPLPCVLQLDDRNSSYQDLPDPADDEDASFMDPEYYELKALGTGK